MAEEEENVAVMSVLRKEISAMKEAVAELFWALENSRSLRIDSEMKFRSAKKDFSLTISREKSFDDIMTAVNRKLCAFRVKFAALRRNWAEVL